MLPLAKAAAGRRAAPHGKTDRALCREAAKLQAWLCNAGISWRFLRAEPEMRSPVEHWAALHAGRSALGTAAMLIFHWATLSERCRTA